MSCKQPHREDIAMEGGQNYDENVAYDANSTDTTAYDLSQMDPEQRAQLEEEWKAELTKVCTHVVRLQLFT